MVAVRLPELPETSRTGTPAFPELPTPPLGGGRNGKPWTPNRSTRDRPRRFGFTNGQCSARHRMARDSYGRTPSRLAWGDMLTSARMEAQP